MTQNCLDDLPFKAGDEVAVMVNGLGGTPLMEQYIAYNKVAQMLKDAGIKVFKSYVNEYCTSIDMAGCSVSLLHLDDEMKKYLDYPVEIPYAIFLRIPPPGFRASGSPVLPFCTVCAEA